MDGIGRMAMGVEFELKFRATPEQLDKVEQGIFGVVQVIEMETTYYDTPDGALSQRKYTLRRRMENGVSVCTLKTPEERKAEGSVPYEAGRGEFEVNCDSIKDAIPELCKLSGVGLTALTAGGVAPVCGARFTRVASTLELPECTVELALDRGVLLGGGREIPLCEMEVELKSGSREAAALYALALAQTYGMTREKHSKFRRALDLARGE